ncbi:MAG TPA: acyl carrier protein [Thiobacillus sp.]
MQLLEEKGAIPGPAALSSYRYLDVGHIDSLAFIKFVFRIEERFGIQFSEADMLGDRVKTVGGLVALIEEKRDQSPAP